LRQLPVPIDFVEVKGEDLVVDVAQLLLSPSRALIDVAPPLGCCCSGAAGAISPEAARARVREQEPPRALAPVVDHSVKLALDEAPPSAAAADKKDAAPIAPVPAPRTSKHSEVVAESEPIAVEAAPRRRSPPGFSRPVLGSMPVARSDAGRQLPRAYVARRRSSPRGVRESSVKGGEPASGLNRRRWILVGAAGVAVGLAAAWLLFLVF
jgi:hypothetical protein